MPIQAEVGGFTLEFPDEATQEQIHTGVSQFLAENQESLGATVVPSQEVSNISAALPLGVSPSDVLPAEQTFDVRLPGEREPSFAETELGRAGGATVGGLTAGLKAQKALAAFPPVVRGVGTIAAGATGAFLGGAAGEAITQTGHAIAGSDLAPESFKEGAIRSLEAGGEEALIDAGLGTMFIGSGAVLSRLKPLASKSAKAIMRILEQGGSNAAIDQVVDKGVFKGISQLTRDAIIGSGKFKVLDEAQDVAITKYLDNFTNELSGRAVNDLTDEALGRFILDVAESGGKAHSEAASSLYRNLDDIIPNPTVLRGTGAAGQPVFGEAGSVNVTSIKRIARDKLDKLQAAGNIGKTAEGGELLEKIVSLDDNVSFAAAHDIRSDVLFRQRALSAAKTGDPIGKNLTDIVKGVDSQMDIAGKALDPAGLKGYREANKFYKFGQKNLNSRLMKGLIGNGDAPAKIGASFAKTGNTDLVRAVRRAFRVNAKVSGRSFDALWKEVQGGFLGQTLPKTADEVAGSAFLRLHKTEKSRNTLRGLFTKAQQKDIVDLSQHLDTIVSARQGRGFLNLKQLGEVQKMGGLIQAGGVGAAVATGGASGLGAAAFFLAGPAVFAKIATSPTIVKKLLRWSTAPVGTALRAKAGVQMARVVGMSIKDFEEFTGEKLRTESKPLIPLK